MFCVGFSVLGSTIDQFLIVVTLEAHKPETRVDCLFKNPGHFYDWIGIMQTMGTMLNGRAVYSNCIWVRSQCVQSKYNSSNTFKPVEVDFV